MLPKQLLADILLSVNTFGNQKKSNPNAEEIFRSQWRSVGSNPTPAPFINKFIYI